MEQLPGLPEGGVRRTPVYIPVDAGRPVGLGDLIQENRFEVNDEELNEAANTTTYSAETDEAWDDFTLDMMRHSCAFFAQEILQGPPEPPYNGRFLIAEHHQEWDGLVAHHDRICVLAPRDHGKTYYFDFAYPIWKAFFGPRTKGFIFSSTQPQAERILEDIKQELTSNPKLRWLVPERPDIWTKSTIRLTNGCTIYARSFGTRVRGAHPHWIVVDDGLNDETAYSEVIRDKQINYFYTAITNMIVPGGQIIVVGTPFSADDLYADLAENEEYEFRRYQAWDEKNNRALWPERYSLELLMARKREIGPIRFNREFQTVPIADDMSLFPSYLFLGNPVEQMSVTLGMPLAFWLKAGIVGTFMGVDFAISSEQAADFFVAWVQGLDRWGNRWILEIDRGKGLSYSDQLSRINALGRKYQCGLIYLEANQMQRIFGDQLIRDTDLPIKQFVTGAQKNTLDKGVPSLRVLLENRKFRIPRGDARSIEMTDIWKTEMHSFTFHQGKLKSVGTHDDTVMACIGPGSMITTIDGKKTIESVRTGDLVLTHKGNWKPVVETMRQDYLGRAFIMRGNGSQPFLITDDHPVWTARPKRDSVANNQRLLVDSDTWDFREARFVRSGRKMEGDYGFSPHAIWEPYSTRFDLSVGLDFQPKPKGGNVWKLEDQFVWWRKDRKVPRYLEVDEDFGFLVGLFLAEGSVGSHQVHFALNVTEIYIHDFILDIAKSRFLALGGESIEGNCRKTWFSSIPASNWFRQLGKHKGKGLPYSWMGWPLSVRLQIVRGWLVGDGSVCGTKRPNSCLGGVSISTRMISQFVWTLQQAGLTPTVNPFKSEGFGGGPQEPAWQLRLNSVDTNSLVKDMNAVEKRRWHNLVLTDRTSPTNARSIALRGGIAPRFTQMDEIEYEGPVFNFQVADDESYVVGDIAVHNCWIADQATRMGAFSYTFGEDEDIMTPEEMDEELVGVDPNQPPSDSGSSNGSGATSETPSGSPGTGTGKSSGDLGVEDFGLPMPDLFR